MTLLIFIPTYNEAENVRNIYAEIKKTSPDADLLFLDDNSPDGTGKILDLLSQSDEKLKIIHRRGKLGIGSAHQEGIRYAYEKKYDELLTMDCDFTHSPSLISVFRKEDFRYSVVVGSRYMNPDSLTSWNVYRKF